MYKTPSMNKQAMFRLHRCCARFGLLALLVLNACSESADKRQPQPVVQAVPGEVYLTPDSPKKAYVKTSRLSLTRPPLLEPLAGKIAYNESATSRISSPVSGRVLDHPLPLGSKVEAGTVLLELHSPEVADAQADYAKAQAQVTLAEHAFRRQQELYQGKVVSRKDLEQAEDDLSQARSEVQRAQNRLKNLQLALAQNNARFALRSPINGVVVERNVNPGQQVGPDLDKPLFVVSDMQRLTVVMDVFEVNLAKIKPGQQLNISVPAYPGETFPATIEYVGQVLSETTRSVQVRCALPNPDGRLLPGMYASINVESPPDALAIVVPLTAVFTEDESDYVFVAVDENHYKQRPVKMGLRLKDRAVVTEGLQPGEQLVTEGALVLRAEEDVNDANP
ncbi:efflux RND transporter periplasmic adaptor subunit [Methylomonas koyamae]|uniref:efflux RND transporter periplasmic adaptor subunit n=1 Tax=Methylomonas koyamae TaxID=702114 RepID=UPI000A697275|nr:efflux RND transporter periplasmic adaptor subunit [Methylomonas koyamae]BBL56825.1 hemolysin secretion protein D [Methylomonas koyamae]